MFKLSHKGVTAPKHYNETNDCSVRSLANASGKTYEECHQIMKELGRVNGLPMDARNFAAGCLRAGGRLELLQIDYFERYQATTKNLKRYLPYMKTGKFVVILPHHSFAVVQGGIIDDRNIDENEIVLCVYKFKQGCANGKDK